MVGRRLRVRQTPLLRPAPRPFRGGTLVEKKKIISGRSLSPARASGTAAIPFRIRMESKSTEVGARCQKCNIDGPYKCGKCFAGRDWLAIHVIARFADHRQGPHQFSKHWWAENAWRTERERQWSVTLKTKFQSGRKKKKKKKQGAADLVIHRNLMLVYFAAFVAVSGMVRFGSRASWQCWICFGLSQQGNVSNAFLGDLISSIFKSTSSQMTSG